MPPKRALLWVVFWISTAIGFSFLILHSYGRQYQIEFLTCYAVEWSLSLDNLFVFLMIFGAFGVSSSLQLRALRWGIIGAMVLRMIFIFLGVTLVGLFEPILYFFGALLIYSAYKMAFNKGKKSDVSENKLIKLMRKKFPITEGFVDDKFFIRRQGMLFATPMLLVLIAIESSDVMFAIDSIPAAFAITREPMIIYTANVFAILGLRSLYFLLAHAERMFSYLKYGVALILMFVGFKMLTAHFIHFNEYLSLGIILFSLVVSVIMSLVFSESKGKV